MSSPKIRLDALLSRYGYCSRREAAGWIKAGRVTGRGGDVFKSSSEKAEPAEVLIDGEEVEYPQGIFVAFNKPCGYTCSHEEKEGDLIYDILPHRWQFRNPVVASVGRLDKDTSGLILLSDDGTLIHKFSSPKHHVEKIYEFTTSEDIPESCISLFAEGTLILPGERLPLKPARLEILSPRQGRLTLTEGRYHQVRRMMESQGASVVTLHRSWFGRLSLEELNLEPGDWVEVDPSEVI